MLCFQVLYYSANEQWGHDFRPDYKRLHVLRERFPGVPMLALTATATPRVRKDILHQLHMKNPMWFMQSFNRTNLKYEVRPKKPKTVTTDIINLIKASYHRQSGIVYCLSRRECDQVALDLRRAGIGAQSYHAGLTDAERTAVQERWMDEGPCKVVCATIAFGMGIDKSDVRDGLVAACILFYTYADVSRLRKMIELDEHANYESKRLHLENLYRMVHYCENVTDCRRSQLLEYFGEVFDRKQCRSNPSAVCDNCSSKEVFCCRDVSEDVKLIIRGVQKILGSGFRRNNFTLLHLVEVFKGSQNAKVMENGHNNFAFYGRGRPYSRSDCERLWRQLVVDGVLAEKLFVTAQDHTVCYMELGRKAQDVLQGRLKVEFQMRKSGPAALETNQGGGEHANTESDITKECYNELVSLAKQISQRLQYKNYTSIFNNATLQEMAASPPLTLDEMKDMDGVSTYKLAQYGQQFLDVTIKYAVMIAIILANFQFLLFFVITMISS
ncbi:hypothetical protein LSAT2_012148 [Lamellibrachia satsuma]|nr:hypothetical protein LSAT2_012148 [Lamellibrachia satsuma]